MRLILVLILSLIVVSVLISSLIRTKRVFEFPSLFCLGIFLFTLPTAIVYSTPRGVVTDFAFNLMVGNALVCAIAGLLGYYLYKPEITESSRTWDIEPDRAFLAILPVGAVSFAAAMYLRTLDVDGDWRGLPVYVLYVYIHIFPAIVVMIFCNFKSPSLLKKAAIGICLIIPVISMIYAGRRMEVGIYAISVTTLLHLLTNWKPPRIAIPAAIAVGLMIFLVFPHTRGKTNRGDLNIFLEVDYVQLFQDSFVKDPGNNEFLEACHNIEAIYLSGQASYGADIYNRIVDQYIPGGIVGYELKNSFRLPSVDYIEIRKQYSQDKNPKNYLAPLGFTSLFTEFRFFGFIFYLLAGMGFKYIYTRTQVQRDDYLTIIIYSLLAISALNITYGWIGRVVTFNIPIVYVLVYLWMISAVPHTSKKRYRLTWITEKDRDTILGKSSRSEVTSP